MPYKNIVRKRAYDSEYWLRVKKAGPSPISAQYNLAVATAHTLADIKVPKHGLKIAVLPDVQAMKGVELDHLTAYGKYIAAKRPDVIVCIGDFGDFPSLSKFERGTRLFEGRRYRDDIGYFHKAMELFMEPIAKEKNYDPWMEFTEGNHENHIERAQIEDPKLTELITTDHLRLADYGWRVHPFLHPIAIGGVAFCHYFPSGVMGKPISSAQAVLRKLHMSAFAGHQQGREIAYSRRADGGNMTAIISGSFYQHTYSYLSPFTNAHWRGAWFLHEVRDGGYDEMALSLSYLKRRFGP
jgi:hypothetical protein